MFDLLKTNEPEDSDMSFWDHLDHLRPRLFRVAIAFIVFMAEKSRKSKKKVDVKM